MRATFIKRNSSNQIPSSSLTIIRPYNALVTLALCILLNFDNLSEGLKPRECGDPSWFSNYPTSDKCFKILSQEMTKDEGVKACLKETEFLYYDPLLTILSPQEQLFVVYEIYEDRHLYKDLWLGGYREGPNDWKWDDNSSVIYSHWKDESHRQENSEKCFRMSSEDHDPDDTGNWSSVGKWEAVSCSSKNLVICQKPKASVQLLVQQKINLHFQRESNKTKRELDQAKKDLQKLVAEYKKTTLQLDQAKQDLQKYRIKLEEVESVSNKSMNEFKNETQNLVTDLALVKNQTKIVAEDVKTKADTASVERFLKNVTDVQSRILNDTATLKENLDDFNIKVEASNSKLQTTINGVRRNVSNLRETAQSLNTRIDTLSTNLTDQITNIERNVSKNLETFSIKLEEVVTESRNTSKSISEITDSNRAFLKTLDTVKEQTDNLAQGLKTKADTSAVDTALKNITNIQDKVVKDLTAVQSLTTRLSSNSLDLQRNLTDLRRNLVPIGFVYIQYPSQQEPWKIWPNTSWSDVSSRYAGAFFRVVGGNSGSFGTPQSDATRQMSQVEFGAQKNGRYVNQISMPKSGWSNWITSSRFSPGRDEETDYLRFEISDVEVRPYNFAVKVYVRVS